jgi:hypothetical protein
LRSGSARGWVLAARKGRAGQELAQMTVGKAVQTELREHRVAHQARRQA